MELDALLPSILAGVIGYSIFGATHGWNPIFSIPYSKFEKPQLLIFFAIFGIFLGIIVPLYVKTFYGIRDFFKKLPIKAYLKPAIGGVLLGTVATFFPYIIGTGYGWLQLSIQERISF